jgi:hypothetical protein
LEKAEVKYSPVTSYPWSLTSLAARRLSSPPDISATAFLPNVERLPEKGTE